ncbi:MAG: nucleotidyltransferase family protein, partial [Planctomycetia bacterium]|nr:nucleotidyltransferase family protein [Planctomycetia bacterium]
MHRQLSIHVPVETITDFCRRRQVEQFAIFGSALRADFGPHSDIDVLVTFTPQARHSFFDLLDMEKELQAIFGRPVELVDRRVLEGSDNYIRRKQILGSAGVVYETCSGQPVRDRDGGTEEARLQPPLPPCVARAASAGFALWVGACVGLAASWEMIQIEESFTLVPQREPCCGQPDGTWRVETGTIAVRCRLSAADLWQWTGPAHEVMELGLLSRLALAAGGIAAGLCSVLATRKLCARVPCPSLGVGMGRMHRHIPTPRDGPATKPAALRRRGNVSK